MTTYDLAKMDHGNYDLPMYNDEFDGVKENCLTYIVGMFEKQVLDSNYSFDIKKYNGCKKEFESVWSHPGYLPNEPWFVRNPNGESEDDGLILTAAYDLNTQSTKLLIIDPIEMKTKQEFELPFRVPWSFHSSYWPKK